MLLATAGAPVAKPANHPNAVQLRIAFIVRLLSIRACPASARLPTWQSAIQQVWQLALQDLGRLGSLDLARFSFPGEEPKQVGKAVEVYKDLRVLELTGFLQ